MAKELNIPVIVMGDLVRRETARRGLELTPENVRNVAISLRKEYGEDILARMVVKEIKEKFRDKCIVLVDGSRSPVEINTIKSEFDVLIVSIEAPFEARVRRIIARRRSDDIGNAYEILKKRDEMEMKLGIGKVIEIADIRIINDKNLEEFKEEAKNILVKLLNKYCRSQ